MTIYPKPIWRGRCAHLSGALPSPGSRPALPCPGVQHGGRKMLNRLRSVEGLLGLRRRYSADQIELTCERCGIVDIISPKALTCLIEQMQREAQAALLADSVADATSTPAYEGRGRFA